MIDKELKDSKENTTERSEEVTDIIDRMPTYWARWVSLCVGVLICIIFLLSYLIEYPDTVSGNITITATNAPVRLVTKQSGRLILLRKNHEYVRKGDVIGCIANGADFSQVLKIEKYLKYNGPKRSKLPRNMELGELSDKYNAYILAYAKYERLMKSDMQKVIRIQIKDKIENDKKLVDNIRKDVKIKDKILSLSKDQLNKDSIILARKGMSRVEYDQQHSDNLSLQEASVNVESNRLSKLSDIKQNTLDVQRSKLEEQDQKDQAYDDYIACKNGLESTIRLWKEQYLIVAPVDGSLEYLSFWRDNDFVEANKEVFTVMPRKANVLGEVIMPSIGAGKVKVGQQVNVKLNKFPYDEYGLLRGTVSSISRESSKVQTKDGVVDTYLLTIKLPQELKTNFGIVLPVDFDTKGVAEIITKSKRLIERLFDNLKAQRVK